MKKLLIATVAFLANSVFAQTFESVGNLRGKTDIKKLTTVLDTSFELLEASSASVTNGEAVTVTSASVVLTGTGGANDTTNTITLGNVAAGLVGSRILLVVDTDSTNLVTIADSGTVNLTTAWIGDNEDALELYVLSVSEFVEVSRADN
jgi:citrate lyase alpha subunit